MVYELNISMIFFNTHPCLLKYFTTYILQSKIILRLFCVDQKLKIDKDSVRRKNSCFKQILTIESRCLSKKHLLFSNYTS